MTKLTRVPGVNYSELLKIIVGRHTRQGGMLRQLGQQQRLHSVLQHRLHAVGTELDVRQPRRAQRHQHRVVHRAAERMGAAQPVQRRRAGLAVEVDQRLDLADPGRDLGIRPRAELVADGLENGFGLVLLALPG
jgi:hypothetical protein